VEGGKPIFLTMVKKGGGGSITFKTREKSRGKLIFQSWGRRGGRPLVLQKRKKKGVKPTTVGVACRGGREGGEGP